MALKILLPVDHAIGISGPHRNGVGSLNALAARHDKSVVLVAGISVAETYFAELRLDDEWTALCPIAVSATC